jgi:hypothetical protein
VKENQHVPDEALGIGLVSLQVTANRAVEVYHSNVSRLGGIARTSSMTKKQRKALAKKAGNARWIKYRRERRNLAILRQIYQEIVEFLELQAVA